MPEGDTIFRLHAALCGGHVRAFDLPRHAFSTEHLIGAEVTQVRALGKNLLIHFADTHVLHTHLKMQGRWQLAQRGERMTQASSLLVVRLTTDLWEARCFHAPVVRLLTRGQARRDPQLQSLGPDLLGEVFDLQAAVNALASAPEPTLAEALLNQRYVAGIGNVYKSELLHDSGLDPFAPASAFLRDELEHLLLRARQLLLRNVQGVQRPSPRAPDAYVRTTRNGCEAGKGPIAVYGRYGDRCYECDTPIQRSYEGAFARSTYYCPTCQPARVAAGATTP
jgi:endonuclease VIII